MLNPSPLWMGYISAFRFGFALIFALRWKATILILHIYIFKTIICQNKKVGAMWKGVPITVELLCNA